MSLGNNAGALIVSVLILLSQTSDRTPPGSRPMEGVVSQETVRPAPDAAKEAETPVPAAPVKPPAPRKSPPPKASPPPAETAPRTKTAPPTEAAPRPETAPPPEAPAPRAAPSPAAAPLDVDSLEKRLRETTAIGVFTKLSLKNQVDDLLAEFREFHKSHDRSMLTRLRQAYDLLLLKVLSLVQDDDPGLARDISSSREALWTILTDPDKFKDL